MGARHPSLLKILGSVVAVCLGLGVLAAAVLVDKGPLKKWIGKDQGNEEPENPPTVRLLAQPPATIAVDDVVFKALGIKTAPAEDPAHPSPDVKLEPRQLQLSGSLGFDTNRFLGINSIFTGQVREIGKTRVIDPETKQVTEERPLDVFDWVEEGQLLCVLWSKDLGMMKSQLIGAVSQLRLDQERLNSLESLLLKSAVPEQSVRDQRQKVESDVIALEAARNTLRNWQIKESEIAAIEEEATKILRREKDRHLIEAVLQLRRDRDALSKLEKKGAPADDLRDARQRVKTSESGVEVARLMLRTSGVKEADIKALEQEGERRPLHETKPEVDRTPEEKWARVEIRAPFAGTILERNVAQGKVINDPTFDLFKLGDLSKLRIWINVFEEELPALYEVNLPIPWTIQPKADPRVKLKGRAEKIGPSVDPNDHTGRIMGMVDNSESRLKAGQFVTATIELPPLKGEIAVPATAIIVDGRDNYLFVQRDPAKPEYTLRKVQVERRFQDWVFVKESDTGTLRPGDRVVTAGAVELKAQIDDLQAAQTAKK